MLGWGGGDVNVPCTQKLDGFWKLLKMFVPTQIRTRDLRDRRICKQVLEHVKKLHVETQCQYQPLDSAWRFSAKNLLRTKNKLVFTKPRKYHQKMDLCCPALQIVINSVKNEKRGFKPDVQIRGNSHVWSRGLRKRRSVFEGVANNAVALFMGGYLLGGGLIDQSWFFVQYFCLVRFGSLAGQHGNF